MEWGRELEPEGGNWLEKGEELCLRAGSSKAGIGSGGSDNPHESWPLSPCCL